MWLPRHAQASYNNSCRKRPLRKCPCINPMHRLPTGGSRYPLAKIPVPQPKLPIYQRCPQPFGRSCRFLTRARAFSEEEKGVYGSWGVAADHALPPGQPRHRGQAGCPECAGSGEKKCGQCDGTGINQVIWLVFWSSSNLSTHCNTERGLKLNTWAWLEANLLHAVVVTYFWVWSSDKLQPVVVNDHGPFSFSSSFVRQLRSSTSHGEYI